MVASIATPLDADALRTLFDTVDALLLVLDDNGVVVHANTAASVKTGVAVEDLVGLPWIERFVPSAEQAEMHFALEQARAGDRGVQLEGRVIRSIDGQIEEHIVRWRFVGRRTGDIVCVYASGLDLTDMRGDERRTRLAEKLAVVGTVSAGLAHEIRNPLNGAALALELLERRLAKTLDDTRAEPLRAPLGVVRTQLDRLSALVTEFLQLARPPKLEPQDVDLVAIARSVIDGETAAAQARDCTIELVGDGPVVVEVDPARVEQVVAALVRNAIESAQQSIVMTVMPDGAGASIRVRDDGPGIPAQNLARIFEPFFSTKPGSTGLGMAIVHSIIERHGGTIVVTCDGGTEVAVGLRRNIH
jgi:PAS domain S-box-containing protein